MSFEKITPTLTLAQLYESQKQYFDAFTVYSKLFSTNPTEEIKDRMETLESKIFSDNSMQYNDLISQIFSEEDKKKLKLLPEEQYNSYKKRMESVDEEAIEFIPDDFEENENDMSEAEEIEVKYLDENPTPELPPMPTILKVNTNDFYKVSENKIEDTQNQNNIVMPPLHQKLETTDFDSLLIDITNIKTHVLKTKVSNENEILNLTISEFAKFIIDRVNKDKKIADLTLLEIKEIRRLLRDIF
jgi:hypothetical protein